MRLVSVKTRNCVRGKGSKASRSYRLLPLGEEKEAPRNAPARCWEQGLPKGGNPYGHLQKVLRRLEMATKTMKRNGPGVTVSEKTEKPGAGGVGADRRASGVSGCSW